MTNSTEKFWNKVDLSYEDDCWNWLGSLDECGYGRYQINKKRKFAHRLSYEIEYGPIPDNLLVCHHCDNPKCVNPKHLFLGTNDDNMKDMARKGRANRSSKNIGIENGSHKLSPEQIIEIRELYSTKTISQSKLGKMYGVSQAVIWKIVTHKNWKHIP